VASLLDSLRRAGAHEQAAALVNRLPAAGMFELFLKHEGSADQFQFGRESDGNPAAPWGWEDLDLWFILNTARRRNRRDDLNNRRSNHSGQLFEAQVAQEVSVIDIN